MRKLDPKLVSMACGVARGIARRCPSSVLVEDLEQAAMVGLLDGLQKHPDGSGPGWEFYLRCRIKGAVLDELRAQDWAGRRRGKSDVPRVVRFEDAQKGWEELIPCTDESPEEATARKLEAAAVWAVPLATRDRFVMQACYVRGIRHKDIGAMLGISEARISQLVARSLTAIQRHLTEGA